MRTILVLDDNVDPRALAAHAAKKIDPEAMVKTPDSWEEGKALLTRLEPGDVVVSDGYMDEGDGWNATARDAFALCPQGVVFILLSADPEDFGDLEVPKIKKPISFKELKSALAGLISS